MQEIKKEVEAILFAAGRTVQINEIKALTNVKDNGLIIESIKDIKKEYEEKDSPLMIVEEGDGWKLTLHEKYIGIVQRINPHTELSKTVLETLAVIAWKQPVLQSEVIKIRTNKAYDHVKDLENLGFIAKEKQGRSYILKATQKFMDYFDLPNKEAIREVFKEFKNIEPQLQKKIDEFKNKEAQEEAEEKNQQNNSQYTDIISQTNT